MYKTKKIIAAATYLKRRRNRVVFVFFTPRFKRSYCVLYAYTFTVTHRVLLRPAQVLHPLLQLLSSYRFGPSEEIRPEPVNLAVAIRKEYLLSFFQTKKTTYIRTSHCESYARTLYITFMRFQQSASTLTLVHTTLFY